MGFALLKDLKMEGVIFADFYDNFEYSFELMTN
jgi:hypothetical protein